MFLTALRSDICVRLPFRSHWISVFTAAVRDIASNWSSVRPPWQTAFTHSYHSKSELSQVVLEMQERELTLRKLPRELFSLKAIFLVTFSPPVT